jgi:hypothetical protein
MNSETKKGSPAGLAQPPPKEPAEDLSPSLATYPTTPFPFHPVPQTPAAFFRLLKTRGAVQDHLARHHPLPSPINIRPWAHFSSPPPLLPRRLRPPAPRSRFSSLHQRRARTPPKTRDPTLAMSLAGSGGLLPPDELLLPFDDGFATEDFFVADPASFNQQQPLLPSTSATNGCCNAKGLAEATTAAVTVAADATSSLLPPSPALPLVHASGHRTSSYRGVTRYVFVACRSRAAMQWLAM